MDARLLFSTIPLECFGRDCCKMKIAFIHYHWCFQVHTINMAEAFASHGNKVYIFCYDLIDKSAVCSNDNIYYIEYKRNKFINLIYKYLLKAYNKNYLSEIISQLLFSVIVYIDRCVFCHYIKKIKFFDMFIGVEKGGAYIAEKCSRFYKKPFIYYSLELYGPEAIVFKWEPIIKYLLKKEKIISNRAWKIILQDHERAKYFQSYTSINLNKVIYFPVSVKKGNFPLRFKSKQNICLCFGNIYSSEKEIFLAANSLPHDWKIILHNSHPQAWIKALPKHSQIIISTHNLSEEEIDILIDHAKIALAYYITEDANNRLIVYSSEKIARYLSRGVPFIINSGSNAESLFLQFPCGKVMRSFGELPLLIKEIISNYDKYSYEAFRAYNYYFNFDNNFERFYEALLDKSFGND